MSLSRLIRPVSLLLLAAAISLPHPARLSGSRQSPTIWQVTLGEPNPVTPEISTEQLQEVPVTAVWVDARSAADFARGSVPGPVNIRKGEAEAANDDGRLPKKDKGTRVIIFGDTPDQARQVAIEVAHKAFSNSSYFGGSFRDPNALSVK